MKNVSRTLLLFLALSWSLQPLTPAQANEGADAALEFSTAALPGKFSSMHLGWFFYNVYMTEWYSSRANQLSGQAAATLMELAANDEARSRMAQFDKEIAGQKKEKKRKKIEEERDAYVESNLDAVDSSKSLNDGQKKKLAIALLQTATATLMQQKSMRNAKRMINQLPQVKTEATTVGNPIGKAKTVKNVGGAAKSLPNSVSNSQESLARLAKISGHLTALAKVNKVKAPSESEVSEAETSYASEITFED